MFDKLFGGVFNKQGFDASQGRAFTFNQNNVAGPYYA